MSKLNVLLLCNLPVERSNASTIIDHISAFPRYSRHAVFRLAKTGVLPSGLDLDRFDVIVIHYTIWITNPNFLAASDAERIRRFRGLKVQFRQDEFFTVDATTRAMRDLGIDIVYTCVPQEEVDKVYSPQALPNARKVTNLTGFVPADMLARKVQPLSQRPIDVSYRARKVPYWLGELGVEKWRIVPGFLEATKHHGLATDLSYEEKDRVYGEKWLQLLTSSKCTLGVESGASVFDFDGSLQGNVESYLAEHPQAEFEEVRDKFFPSQEGRIYVNQISPRCFEAAALRTAMVLFEGSYSGILKPWQHYVPLKKDFSNIEEVVAAIKDPGVLQEIADRTYREIAMNPLYSYQHFIAGFDDVIEKEFGARAKPAAVRPYSRASYRFDLARSPRYVVHRFIVSVLQRVLLGTGLRRVLLDIWYKLPLERREQIRPLLRLIGKWPIAG
jgi:hypothetical protein